MKTKLNVLPSSITKPNKNVIKSGVKQKKNFEPVANIMYTEYSVSQNKALKHSRRKVDPSGITTTEIPTKSTKSEPDGIKIYANDVELNKKNAHFNNFLPNVFTKSNSIKSKDPITNLYNTDFSVRQSKTIKKSEIKFDPRGKVTSKIKSNSNNLNPDGLKINSNESLLTNFFSERIEI